MRRPPPSRLGPAALPVRRAASRAATHRRRPGLYLLRKLPRLARERFGAFVGWLVWSLRIRRRVALDNVRQALPEKTRPSSSASRAPPSARCPRRCWSRSPPISSRDAEVERAVSVADWKGLDVLLAGHQPVLIASAHLGSWELFAEVMARRGHIFSAVVRPLQGAFNEWLVRSRERAGVELILQRGALRNMLKAMRRGRAVVQLIDQALPGPEAMWVPFFGRPRRPRPRSRWRRCVQARRSTWWWPCAPRAGWRCSSRGRCRCPTPHAEGIARGSHRGAHRDRRGLRAPLPRAVALAPPPVEGPMPPSTQKRSGATLPHRELRPGRG